MIGIRPGTVAHRGNTWALHGRSTTYALRWADDTLRHVWWGPALTVAQAVDLGDPAPSDGELTGEELPAEGGRRFGPPGLRVGFADGNRAVEWRLIRHRVDGGQLSVTLADRYYPLEIELHYRVFPDSDVVERSTLLRNTDPAEPVTVQTADAACWQLPARPRHRLSCVTGGRTSQVRLSRGPLPAGETILGGRHGVTGDNSNPWVMVDAGDAGEEHGEVWSAALAWSGSWHITVWRGHHGEVGVAGGTHHDAGPWRLLPGETWQTPVFAGLYSAGGFGATSREWHRYVRTHVLPAGDEPRPVVFSSRGGPGSGVDEAGQLQTAAVAAELGAELYLLGDGWQCARTSDRTGLGDWWPDPDRFPRGLGPLISEVHRLGMRFGIWVEPEAVNPDSELYRRHPDWVLHLAHRRRTEVRNRLVLNFARPDVAEWAHAWLDRLLTEHDIDLLRWGMHRPFTEAGWPDAADPQRLFVDHTRSVYAIIDRLRADHPRLRVQTCGVGRLDLGMLGRAEVASICDDTDPVDLLARQHAHGHLYPALTMDSFVGADPATGRSAPLSFRFHVAMAGAPGFSGDLRRLPAEQRADLSALVAAYRRLRLLVQQGDLYRLTPVALDRPTAVQYVAVDGTETAVLAWRVVDESGARRVRLRLRGLDPAARYRDVDDGTEYDGVVLRHVGLAVDLPPGDHASAVRHLRRMAVA